MYMYMYMCLQSCHWSTLFSGRVTESLVRSEEKRREAVWEVLQAELSYLYDHLMVLKHVSPSDDVTTLATHVTLALHFRCSASWSR